MRRVCKTVLGAAIVAAVGVVQGQHVATSNTTVLDTRYRGYVPAVCAYSFRKFTAYEAIEKTKEAGGEAIEFYLWQKLSPEYPDVKLNQDLSDKQIAELRAKLQAWGVRPVNAYFSSANLGTGEEDARKLFEFARKLGLEGLTGEPPVDKLEMLEKLVRQYNIQLCFHNHAKNEQKPEYRNWDPDYLAGLMKERDSRMGFCVDMGHVHKTGLAPVDFLKKLGDRVLSLHIKEPGYGKAECADAKSCQDCKEFKTMIGYLKRQKFSGHIGVEIGKPTNEVEQQVKAGLDALKANL